MSVVLPKKFCESSQFPLYHRIDCRLNRHELSRCLTKFFASQAHWVPFNVKRASMSKRPLWLRIHILLPIVGKAEYPSGIVYTMIERWWEDPRFRHPLNVNSFFMGGKSLFLATPPS